MPDYYRADLQTPLFTWIILTNKQLILLGEADPKYFKLNAALKITRNKNREGVTTIVIKSSWKQCIIRGCFGSCEDQLIKILQVATRISAERNILANRDAGSPLAFYKLAISAVLLGLSLATIWIVIIKSFLTN